MVADHDILLEYMNQLTIEDLCLKDDLERYPFVFSREDRNEKIDYPEMKIEKESGEKDKDNLPSQAALEDYALLKKTALTNPRFMENDIKRLDIEKLIASFVETTGVQ